MWYPDNFNNIIKLTSPKINVDGTSGEINKQINTIIENSLSVYKVNVQKLKELNPDFIITQAHCDVCAVSLLEVKNIVNKYLGRKTKIISLQPNTLNDVFNDIKRVAKDLNIENETNSKLIENLKIRLQEIKKLASTQKQKPSIACIEWIDPLMVAGNWIPEMVEIVGGTNLLGKSGDNSHWIQFEEIINQNPEIIPLLQEIAVSVDLPNSTRLKAIKPLAKFKDERSLNAIIEMLEDPKNYIFYYDIIMVMDEFGGYNEFKTRIREVGHRAMLNQRIVND